MSRPTRAGNGPRSAVVDWGKLSVLITCLVCTTVLAALRVLGADTASLILVSVSSYALGNGVRALSGRAPSPLIDRRNHSTSDLARALELLDQGSA